MWCFWTPFNSQVSEHALDLCSHLVFHQKGLQETYNSYLFKIRIKSLAFVSPQYGGVAQRFLHHDRLLFWGIGSVRNFGVQKFLRWIHLHLWRHVPRTLDLSWFAPSPVSFSNFSISAKTRIAFSSPQRIWNLISRTTIHRSFLLRSHNLPARPKIENIVVLCICNRALEGLTAQGILLHFPAAQRKLLKFILRSGAFGYIGCPCGCAMFFIAFEWLLVNSWVMSVQVRQNNHKKSHFFPLTILVFVLGWMSTARISQRHHFLFGDFR